MFRRIKQIAATNIVAGTILFLPLDTPVHKVIKE
jgi:hypothetical protein